MPVELSPSKEEGPVSTTIGGRTGATVNSVATIGCVIASAVGADSAEGSLDLGIGGNITGSTSLFVMAFEFEGLAASVRVPVMGAFGIAFVSSPWRMTGRTASGVLFFDVGRVAPLPSFGWGMRRDPVADPVLLDVTITITISSMHVPPATIE
jgi:hypothetical protein